jgi:hypothetical protein
VLVLWQSIDYAPAPMSSHPLGLLLFAGVSLAAFGCAPEIGDACETPLDCSAQGSRLCDRTEPGGYCTVSGCEHGTCPDESVCVSFRPCQERLAATYCMLKCSDDSDCRDDEGYRCTSAAKFGEDMMDAKILGKSSQRFCSIPPTFIAPERADAGKGDPGPPGDAGECRALSQD